MPDSCMTSDQLARGEALQQARTALAQRNMAGSGPVTIYELITAAHWIMTGDSEWVSIPEVEAETKA